VDGPRIHAWSDPWVRVSVLAVVGITIVASLIGFVWLPSSHADFSAAGIWQSICRAAGVPVRWSEPSAANAPVARTTAVVLTRSMAHAGNAEDIGRGATIALRCTICHGARGLTDSDAPNLAGQYPEVIVKQVADYRNGDRSNTVMQAYAGGLSTAEVHDVAAYYADLPRARDIAPVGVPPLVRAGDPMRNIAPCASCHGGIDHKLGAPWLFGMPKNYLMLQLASCANGQRHNDSHSQMRNMARRLSSAEVGELAPYYARP